MERYELYDFVPVLEGYIGTEIPTLKIPFSVRPFKPAPTPIVRDCHNMAELMEYLTYFDFYDHRGIPRRPEGGMYNRSYKNEITRMKHMRWDKYREVLRTERERREESLHLEREALVACGSPCFLCSSYLRDNILSDASIDEEFTH